MKALSFFIFAMSFSAVTFAGVRVPDLKNNFCRPIEGSKRYLTSDFSMNYPKKVRFECSYECQSKNQISTIIGTSEVSVSSMDGDAKDVVCQGVRVKKVTWGYDFDGSDIFYAYDTGVLELKRWAFQNINQKDAGNTEETNRLIKLRADLMTVAGAYAVAGHNGGNATKAFTEAAMILSNIGMELPGKSQLLDQAIKQIIINRGIVSGMSAETLVQNVLKSQAAWRIPSHQF